MKQQLIKKAETLFLRYGIRSISMDDIARELGMSKKTLYQHIENKENLIEHIFSIRYEEEREAMAKFLIEGQNAIEEMVLVAKYIIDRMRLISPSFKYDLEKYYPAIYKELDEFHWTFYLECTLANLKRGKKEGLYRANLNENIIAKIFIGISTIISTDQVFPTHDYPLDDLVSRAFLYHIHGIVSAKGLVELCQFLGEEEKEYL